MGASRTCKSTLALLGLLSLSAVATGATVFYDDFEDGNAADGSPVRWVVEQGWPYGTFRVSGGDLLVTATQSGASAIIGVSSLTLGDSSIRAQVRLEGVSDEAVAVFLRGAQSGGVGKSHAIEIAADGGLWFGVASQYERISTDFRPTEEEIILQIDAIGNIIRYWAWRASEEKPAVPLRDHTDSELPIGIPGVYYTVSNPPQISPGTAVYRYVHVANTPIPERPVLAGDFDGNLLLDTSDIDALAAQIRGNSMDTYFDVDSDKRITMTDFDYWVRELKNTWYGDANLNGEFNTGDLVHALGEGKYETQQDAGWGEGDWNGDGVFGTGDLVKALQDGGYEQGPRTAPVAVPEPTSLLLLLAGGIAIAVRQRHFGT